MNTLSQPERYLALAAVMFVVLISGCRKRVSPTEVDMTEYGWVLYSDGRYRDANNWFLNAVFEDTAYKDGYNGLGWTYGRVGGILGAIDSSIINFRKGLTRALRDTTARDLNLLLSEPPHDVAKECAAGLTLAYHAKDNHLQAVTYGNLLLTMAGDTAYAVSKGSPRWQFSRDPAINSKHIIWTLASSNFSLGNFDESLNLVVRLMSDTTTFLPLNPAKVEDRRRLAEQIEFLRNNL